MTSHPPRAYHHGNLRQALLNATLDLAEETHLEQVSLREVARRVGVSPTAPFRHFKDRRALMTALAEEALRQLNLIVTRDQQSCPTDALARLQILGSSFLQWALRHPTQFRLVSSRHLYDFNSSAGLAGHFAAVRNLTVTLVEAAQQAGQLPPETCATQLALGMRACAYGLARMVVDGQLPQWDVPDDRAMQTAQTTLDMVLYSMATRVTPSEFT